MTASIDLDQSVDPERVAHASERLLSADDASGLAGLLGLLSDPVRSRILSALDHFEELCVGDLALVLGVDEDAVTDALRLLRTAGLVSNRRVGRVVHYRLGDHFPEPLLAHCLRQVIALTGAVAGEDDSTTTALPTSSEEQQP